MSFNGSGTFVINSSGQPVVANTVISSTVFNALTADLATGLSTCITKDGQTTPTANIPMGTFKFTGLGNGSAATDSATLGQVQASTTKLVTVTGSDTIAGTMNPALTAYASGQMFYFIAAGANTGAVTLNIDGLGARNVTRDGSTALAANDILSGEVALVVYDGTRFQLLNPANAGSMTVSNLTVTGTTTLSGLTASTALALDASKNVVSVTNTGTGNNVLATSPTLVTPTLGAASATSVAAGLGAVGTPSYTFTGDLNTGLWSPAADTLAVSTGGSERLRVDSSGNVGIGTASPGAKLQVIGTTSDQIRVGTAATEHYRIGRNASDGLLDFYGSQTGFQGYRFGGIDGTWAVINSSGNLGIGTASPTEHLHINGSGNQRTLIESTSASGVAVSTQYKTATRTWEVGNGPGTGTNVFNIFDVTAGIVRFTIDANGNTIAGNQGALATNATNGFLYVPTCAGTPTGTPTAITGMAPIVVDTTNNKMYFYSGGQWRDAGP